MVSRNLMLTWAFFDICLLAAGLVTLILSLVWRQPNLLLNFTFSGFDYTGGTVLGIIFLTTFASSLALMAFRSTKSLAILNWLLLINGMAIIVYATPIWFSTLHEREHYHQLFGMQTNATRIAIQDMFHCCGYFTASDEVAFGGNVCSSAAAAVAVNTTCVSPITKFADTQLNHVFSTVYGFMCIVIGLFLSTMCLIKRRQEEERFERIDAKRDGPGFV